MGLDLCRISRSSVPRNCPPVAASRATMARDRWMVADSVRFRNVGSVVEIPHLRTGNTGRANVHNTRFAPRLDACGSTHRLRSGFSSRGALLRAVDVAAAPLRCHRIQSRKRCADPRCAAERMGRSGSDGCISSCTDDAASAERTNRATRPGSEGCLPSPVVRTHVHRCWVGECNSCDITHCRAATCEQRRRILAVDCSGCGIQFTGDPHLVVRALRDS